MITTVSGYESATTFAKHYATERTRNRGGSDSSKITVYRIIKKELEKPNSTELDVFVIGGKTYVKLKATTSQTQIKDPKQKTVS